MNIAIFHNFMDNIGGAEKVSLILARELGADIYTTVANKRAIRKLGFNETPIPIGWIPTNPPLRQQAASWRFERLKLKDRYDMHIIAGDWALSASMHNTPSMWYCHTPSRELWDLRAYTRTHIVPTGGKHIFDLWTLYNRARNKKHVHRVHSIACSSKNAQTRVRKYFSMPSDLIYPPIDTQQYTYASQENWWLSVNRLIPYKRVDMQIEAFRNMPDEKLVIVGSYEKSRHFQSYASYIRRILPPNVTLLSWVNDAKLKQLYATCKGFITTSQGEDFGMTAVEAMASGKPVIAPNEGGYVETVIPDTTGLLIEPTPQNIVQAVRRISMRPKSYKYDCTERARMFDTSRAVEAFQQAITRCA